jgi:TetR/AcrR family transcriptional repressor of nem operon
MARPRAVEEKDLLDAAMFAFWEAGYGGVSTRALEQATGLPSSSLYHRYGSKEGVFVAALEHYVARVVCGRIERHLQQDDALNGLREFFCSVYRSGSHPYHACLLANTWTELGNSLPAVSKTLAQGNQQLLSGFSGSLVRGKAQGSIRADLDPREGALYLLMSLQGLLATARGVRDHHRLDALVDMLLSAVTQNHTRKSA